VLDLGRKSAVRLAWITTIDLCDHLVDICGWVSVPGSGSNRPQFLAHLSERLSTQGCAQRVAYPLRDSHAPGAGRPLNLTIFRLLEKNLKSLAHGLSVFYPSL